MSKHVNASLPPAEAAINPLPKLQISVPLHKDLGNFLDSFHLFPNLPTELKDEIWTAAVKTNTVLAPQRAIENGQVNWNKPAIWSFQGADPNAIGRVCQDSRAVMKKHCVAFRGHKDAKITTKGPMIYANPDTTMFVLGDFFTEHESFRDEDIAKMKYITIEARQSGPVWNRDLYELTPGSICLDMELLAKVAKSLKAVFVQAKLCHSAGEDPEAISQQVTMAWLPEPVPVSDGIRPLNGDLFTYLSNFVGYEGPNIDDERRCTYYQYRERQWCEVVFAAEDAFAGGAPAIHFLPLYSPSREYYKDAKEERQGKAASCHHELSARSEVTDAQANKICRPPRGLTETQVLLNARQAEMEDYEVSMMADWLEWI